MAVILSELAQISGLTAFLSDCVAFLLATIIFSKGIKEKSRTLVVFGFTAIFTVSPWFGSGFGYIYWVFTGEAIPYYIYILLGNMLLPIAIITWLDIYGSMVNPDRKKLYLIIFIAISIIFEIYLFYYLFYAGISPLGEWIDANTFGNIFLGTFDVDAITSEINPIDIDYRLGLMIYLATLIMTTEITGIQFARTSLKIDDKELKVKGKFILVGFICFGIGATFDALIEQIAITLVIFRFVLITATICFYIGFILPKWVKRLVFSEDKVKPEASE